MRKQLLYTAAITTTICMSPLAIKAIGSEDMLYKTAFESVIFAKNNGTQESVNVARKAIVELNNTKAKWAIGEFSKQVDEVQQKLFKEFMGILFDSDNNSVATLTQQEINRARTLVSSFSTYDGNNQYISSWSSAVDRYQQKNIDDTVKAIELLKLEYNKEAKERVIKLLEELLSVENNQLVLNMAEKLKIDLNILIRSVEGNLPLENLSLPSADDLLVAKPNSNKGHKLPPAENPSSSSEDDPIRNKPDPEDEKNPPIENPGAPLDNTPPQVRKVKDAYGELVYDIRINGKDKIIINFTEPLKKSLIRNDTFAVEDFDVCEVTVEDGQIILKVSNKENKNLKPGILVTQLLEIRDLSDNRLNNFSGVIMVTEDNLDGIEFNGIEDFNKLGIPGVDHGNLQAIKNILDKNKDKYPLNVNELKNIVIQVNKNIATINKVGNKEVVVTEENYIKGGIEGVDNYNSAIVNGLILQAKSLGIEERGMTLIQDEGAIDGYLTAKDIQGIVDEFGDEIREVKKLIDEIKGLPKEIKEQHKSMVMDLRERYEALIGNMKDLVGDNVLNILIDAEGKIKELEDEEEEKEIENKEKVDAVIKAINELPNNLTLSHEKDVIKAREQYNSLDDGLKELVINIELLKKAEVNMVELFIGTIPKIENIGLNLRPYISSIADKYNILDEVEKSRVSNLNLLIRAEIKLEIKYAESLDGLSYINWSPVIKALTEGNLILKNPNAKIETLIMKRDNLRQVLGDLISKTQDMYEIMELDEF